MSDVAKTHTDQLERIKRNIENSYESFIRNATRFVETRNFVFVSSISDAQRSVLTELKKPQLEFNILEAYISRLCGEFAKAEPSIKISGKDGHEADPELIEFLDGHLRWILKEANKEGLEYNCYRDTLSGGFSGMKVYTQYTSEMSFHQDIKMTRVFDPTLMGFDPMATKPDKSDADYCFEIFPKRKDDFMKEHPNIDLSSMKFKSANGDGTNLGPFQWAFKTGRDEIILVGDYYEKKKTEKMIVMLTDGQVMTTSDYKKFLMNWEMEGKIEQPPLPMGKPRKTTITKIVRYKVIESQVFDYEETDFKNLPLIFIDGNSLLAKEGGTGQVSQMTRPYILQAIGAQQLKNYAGQTLANELEMVGAPKTVVSLEAMNEKYLDGFTDPQNAIVQVYNAFHNGDPNIPLPPPIQPPRPQIPPEISAAFMGADAIVQNVLGSFDATMSKLTQEQVSGVAIEESITLSNSAAMPYVFNYLLGLQSAAQMAVDLIPLYYRTPRTVPVINSEGKMSYVKINQEGGLKLDYEHDAMQVSVEAGVSFSVQQTRALQQINALAHSSPLFGEFINEVGLDIILDNVEIRNVETLRERSEQWMKHRMQMKQQMMEQQAKQPNIEQMAVQVAQQQVQNELQVGMANIEMKLQTEQAKVAMKQAELQMEAEKNRAEMMKTLADIELGFAKLGIERQKVDDQRLSIMLDSSIKQSEHKHDVVDKQLDKAIRSFESINARDAELHARAHPKIDKK